jgi:hypothetical protein
MRWLAEPSGWLVILIMQIAGRLNSGIILPPRFFFLSQFKSALRLVFALMDRACKLLSQISMSRKLFLSHGKDGSNGYILFSFETIKM